MASCPLQLILMGEIFTEHHGFLSTAAYFNGRDIYRTPWLLVQLILMGEMFTEHHGFLFSLLFLYRKCFISFKFSFWKYFFLPYIDVGQFMRLIKPKSSYLKKTILGFLFKINSLTNCYVKSID